jgi:hypothetical protein
MVWSKQDRHHFRLILVSLLCFTGAGAGGYFLYLDLNQSGRAGIGKTLGKVERREATVRRKQSSSYVWTLVQPSENLYRKDSIQTGRGSAVSIRLNDGSLLDLGEDSLVVMDDTTELALSFMRGTAVVHKPEGDSQIIVSKDGKTQVEVLAARLLRPEPLTRYFVLGKETKKVLFSWELRSKTPAGGLILQVSLDPFFNLQRTQVLSISNSDQKSISLSLGPGRYYWRLQSQGKSLTETRQFRLLSAFPLKATWPEQNQKVALSGNEPKVQFRWVSDSEVTSGDHRLEIARDIDFKHEVRSDSVSAQLGFAVFNDLPEGIYFWRIRSTYGDLKLSSEIRSFQLSLSTLPKNQVSQNGVPSPTPVTPILLPIPSSVLPESGATLTLLRSKSPIEISWATLEGAKAYEVIVYEDQKKGGHRKLVLHVKTAKSTLSLKNLGPGTYLWTVRGIDSENVPGSALPFRRLTLSYGDLLAPPQVVSPEVQ